MNLFNKIFGGAKQKTYLISDLARLFGDDAVWGDSKMLSQYGNSVYVYACVDKISKYVSTIDWHLYSLINSQGDNREVFDHPVLNILYKPNEFQTRTEFLRIAMINKKLTGKVFWYKVRNASGKVVELWNISPRFVQILNTDGEYISGYRIMYQGNNYTDVTLEDMIYIKEPNPLHNFEGMSAVTPAQSRIDTEGFAIKFQRNFFINSARPEALLKTETKLNDQQATDLENRWNSKYQGIDKSSKVAILGSGVEYQQIALSQREMDYIESLNKTRDDILIAFGVPKSIITTDDVNRANAEAGLYMFMTQTIKPEMIQLTEALNEMLIVPDFDERLFLTYSDPTPEDRTQKLNEYTQGVDKWITRNEIRSQLGLEPMDGGDVLYTQGLAMPLGQEPEPVDVTNSLKGNTIFASRRFLKEKMQVAEAITEAVEKSKKRIIKPVKGKKKKAPVRKSLIVGDSIRKLYSDIVNKSIDSKALQFKKALGRKMKIQENNFKKEVEDAMDAGELNPKKVKAIFLKKKADKDIATFAQPYLSSILDMAIGEATDLVGAKSIEKKISLTLMAVVKERSFYMADSVNKTTLEKVVASIMEGLEKGEGKNEISDRIGEVYSEYSDYRLDTIARTEATNMSNEGFLEGYSQSDAVSGKEWIATMDDRTRPEHVSLNGDIVGLKENFDNGLPFPQEVNCRCVIAPAVSD